MREKKYYSFTKRHESSIDPFFEKCLYKCTKDDICDSCQLRTSGYLNDQIKTTSKITKMGYNLLNHALRVPCERIIGRYKHKCKDKDKLSLLLIMGYYHLA